MQQVGRSTHSAIGLGVSPGAWIRATVLVCLGCGQSALPAQEAAAPYTLHVYANLVQIPTLVLYSTYLPMPPIPIQKFSIRLDSGPPFQPTKMRMEGDDPISLAILLDASGNQERLVATFGDALAQMTQASLHPRDHVSIFAVDCKLVRSSNDVPAAPETLRAGVAAVLAAPDLHGPKGKPSCGRSLHLWDALAQVTQLLSTVPGRRTILLVSSGVDQKSGIKFAALKQFADDKSVAIFGLRDLTHFTADHGITKPTRFVGDMASHDIRFASVGLDDSSSADSAEDLYYQLCERTGGLILTIPREALESSLERYISMLRGRYILEFPRPNQATPGVHGVQVQVPNLGAYVTSAGVTVALPDAKVLDDPLTVPSSPSPATLGTRRPLSPH